MNGLPNLVRVEPLQESLRELGANVRAVRRRALRVDAQKGGDGAAVKGSDPLSDLSGHVRRKGFPVALPPLSERLDDHVVPEHGRLPAQIGAPEGIALHHVHHGPDAVLRRVSQIIGKGVGNVIQLVAQVAQAVLVLIQHVRHSAKAAFCPFLEPLAPFPHHIDLKGVLNIGHDAAGRVGGQLVHHACVVPLHAGQKHFHGGVPADLAALQVLAHLLKTRVVASVPEPFGNIGLGSNARFCQLVQLLRGKFAFALNLGQGQYNALHALVALARGGGRVADDLHVPDDVLHIPAHCKHPLCLLDHVAGLKRRGPGEFVQLVHHVLALLFSPKKGAEPGQGAGILVRQAQGVGNQRLSRLAHHDPRQNAFQAGGEV